MTRTDRFWKFFLTTMVSLCLVTLGMVVYIITDLPPLHKTHLVQIFQHEMYPLILLGFIIFTVFWVVGDIVYNRYIRPIKCMAAEAEIIYGANPSHRLTLSGSRDIRTLTRVINDFADIFEHLDREIKTQILSAKRETETERNLLAAVMDQIPQGVVICNTQGEIIFYNHQAKTLLSGIAPETGSPDLGLGRSIFHFIEGEKIQPLLEQNRETQEQAALCISGSDNTFFSVTPSLVLNTQSIQPSGFMLIFQAADPENPPKACCPPHILVQGSRPEFLDFYLFTPPVTQGSQSLKKLKFTVLDTETTGLCPDQGDEIISIAALRIVNQRIVYRDSFEELINPQRHIPMDSYRIHGIHPDMVADKETIDTVLPRFRNFVSQTILVGHNIAFDMKMFKVKEAQTGVSFTNSILDTLLLSALLQPAHQDHGLEAIAKRLGVDIIGRHTALGDAVATAKIFLKLIPLLEDNGILTLEDALSASQKTYYARLRY